MAALWAFGKFTIMLLLSALVISALPAFVWWVTLGMTKRAFLPAFAERPLLLAALLLHVVPFLLPAGWLLLLSAGYEPSNSEGFDATEQAIFVPLVFLPLLILTVAAWLFRTIGAALLLGAGLVVSALVLAALFRGGDLVLVMFFALSLGPPLGAVLLLVDASGARRSRRTVAMVGDREVGRSQ